VSRFVVVDVEQRTPEWYQARAGRLCASDANDMLATIQKGEAAGRRNLRAKILLERLTGKPQESNYQSQAMLNGIEREGDGLRLYEAVTGTILCRSGFVQHAEHAAGWSPDAHTDDWSGFVEAKCPEPATHLETIVSNTVPTKYLRQMLHGGFWIGGAQWGDFVSYHPDFPEEMRLHVIRLQRNEADVRAYEVSALAFLKDVDADVARVQAILQKRRAA